MPLSGMGSMVVIGSVFPSLRQTAVSSRHWEAIEATYTFAPPNDVPKCSHSTIFPIAVPPKGLSL